MRIWASSRKCSASAARMSAARLPEIRYKKNVGTTRTFRQPLTTEAELGEAVADFAARCGKKLRRQHSGAASLTAYIQTNHLAPTEPQRSRSFAVTFTTPTNSTLQLVQGAKFALSKIFREGFQYKRAGVLLSGLVNQSTGQMSLFDPVDHDKHQRLMSALDSVNTRFGRNAAQTIGGAARLTQQNRLSPSYTTRWKDLLTVQCGNPMDLWVPGRD